MPKMSGAQFMADALDAYGVTHIFFVPTILSHSLAQMETRGTRIARILTHGEKAAAYMADGYARASGRPGVCMAQIVGGVNLAAGLRDAHLACAPVLAFTGGTTPQIRYRNAYQETEDISAFDPVTKFNAAVDSVERFPDMLRQAFRVATSGTPGPVHLRFGGNLGQVEQEEAELRLVVEENFRRVPAYRPEPSAESVACALEAIREARRPVIVAGGGVRTSQAGAELVALAEKLRIPVATSMNGKESIPGNHPLSVGVVGTYSRRSANRIVSEADLVFFVGTQTGGMTTHFWRVPRVGTPAVQLDIDPEELGRNYPLRASIMGDAKVSLRKMLGASEETAPARGREEWLARAAEADAAWRAEAAPLLESDAAPIRPERICRELGAHLPDDAIVLADTGHAGMWTGGYLDLTSPGASFLRAAGHLGWGFPAALGAKCGAPERPVVLFTGDAGFWYHIAEVETAARWGLHVVVIVNNNGSQNQETKIFDEAYGGAQGGRAHELWHFNRTDFREIAQSMGARGVRVERAGEIAGALDEAFNMRGGPVVLDVVTDIRALAPAAYAPAE